MAGRPRKPGTASPALRARVQAARAWGDRQTPPAIYIPTGAIGRHPPAECVAMAAILMQAGVPARPVRPPANASQTGERRRWCWRMREVPALPYDAALMIWARLRGSL